jgi:hypothetical protein
MSLKKLEDAEWIEAFRAAGGNFTLMAENTKTNIRTLFERRKRIEKKYGKLIEASNPSKNRLRGHVTKTGHRITENVTGSVIVFSDAHFWPGDRSKAYEALLIIIKRLKPVMIVCNGDAFDGAKISRHPPLGWTDLPNVANELETVKARMKEIEDAAPSNCKLLWAIGNHDMRFNNRLAEHAPEYVKIKGMDLADHFPAWDFGMSIWLNDSVIIKHRHHNGVHGAYNNVMKGGKTIVTGHNHRLQSIMFANYAGLRWGIECGMLADHGPENDKFLYLEDNAVNWSQGFVCLTFTKQGYLLEPEFCRVLHGNMYWRGEKII